MEYDFANDATQAPNINRLIFLALVKSDAPVHLRCIVLVRINGGNGFSLIDVDAGKHIEYLGLGVFRIHQDVMRFDLSVYDILIMHTLDAVAESFENI